MNPKQIAAEKAVDFVKDNMVIGLGTGSTVYWAIQRLGLKVKDGLRIQAIATSIHSEVLAQEAGIPLTSFAQVQAIDLTIDGADEVDPQCNLIKGGGGALLREKIVATASKTFIVVVDESKLVPQLGKFPLPVEVVPFGWEMTANTLQHFGCTPTLRVAEGKPFITDNGNFILDCAFGVITQPVILHTQILQLPGVVNDGLFLNLADQVIIGHANGTFTIQ